MNQKEMPLSLRSDVFSKLVEDYDIILARTVGNMTLRGADEAVITLKLGISLEKVSVETPEGLQDVVKPSFKHDINSVMQIKDKMTGQFKGAFGMVYDKEKNRWVLRTIDDGQIDLFDKADDTIETEGHVVEPKALSGDPESVMTPFEWLCQFIGVELHVSESMGNYSVRTGEGRVVLSSATSPDSPFYCDEGLLMDHVGCNIVCVGYGQDEIVSVAIECEDCGSVVFSLDAPAGEGQEIVSEYVEEEEEEEYIYEDPEGE